MHSYHYCSQIVSKTLVFILFIKAWKIIFQDLGLFAGRSILYPSDSYRMIFLAYTLADFQFMLVVVVKMREGGKNKGGN